MLLAMSPVYRVVVCALCLIAKGSHCKGACMERLVIAERWANSCNHVYRTPFVAPCTLVSLVAGWCPADCRLPSECEWCSALQRWHFLFDAQSKGQHAAACDAQQARDSGLQNVRSSSDTHCCKADFAMELQARVQKGRERSSSGPRM